MPDKSDTFLAEGLRNYPDAHATVEQFKRQLRERVMARISSHGWRTWKPNLKGLSTTHSESDGLWLGASCTGHVEGFGDPVSIDAGLWWGRTDGEGYCEVGLSAWNCPEWLKRAWRVPEPFAKRGISAERKYLFLPLPEGNTDFEGALDSVLAAFDACAAQAKEMSK